MVKILILYVFHEYNNRVNFFIENALFQDDDINFLFICNNMKTNINLPPYVKLIKRENIGYDFGGWSHGLLLDELYKRYDYFIFVNSSVLGPFLRKSFVGKWTDIYINGLKDNIKLFGSTINCDFDPVNKAHVQSYIFSMNLETVEFLMEHEIFSTTNYAKSFCEAIWNKEVLMSRLIIRNGWNIGCLFKQLNDVDFTFKYKTLSEYGNRHFNDIMNSYYYNKLWTEYDIVFVKGNRKINYRSIINNDGKLSINKNIDDNVVLQYNINSRIYDGTINKYTSLIKLRDINKKNVKISNDEVPIIGNNNMINIIQNNPFKTINQKYVESLKLHNGKINLGNKNNINNSLQLIENSNIVTHEQQKNVNKLPQNKTIFQAILKKH